MTWFTQQWTRLIFQLKWPILIASLLVPFALMFLGAKNFYFATDYRIFFSKENQQLMAFEKIQDIYAKTDNVAIVVAPKDGNVFTPETLAVVQEITEKAWQIPYSTRVDSITNFQHTYAEEDDLIVGDLVEYPDELTEQDLARIRDITANEPQMKKRLISDDGAVTNINVTIQLPGKQLDEVPSVVAFSRNLRDEIEAAYPDVDIYLSGIVMLNAAFAEESQKDMGTLMPLMFLVVVVTLLLMLRSFTAAGATVVIIMLSVVATMGIWGVISGRMTGPTVTAPVVILTMAVADCVHLLVVYLHYLRQGIAKQEAMAKSMHINFQAIFITSLTTVIGFLTMNFSEVPPFRDLGNIVAMGVALAFILSVTTLPALMIVLPTRQRKEQQGKTSLFMAQFGDWVVHKRRPLLIISLLISCGFVALIPKNELNDQFFKYFTTDVEFRKDTDFMLDNLGGMYTMEFHIEQGESNGIADPVFLSKIGDLVDWLRAQPEVHNIHSLSDTFKRLNKNMHGDDPAWHKLPEERPLAAQYLLLYEMSLPYGLDLNNQINVDKSATRIVVTFRNFTTKEALVMESRIHHWLAANHPDLNVELSSTGLMFSHIGERNVKSMLKGSLIAIVLISGILIFAFRSVGIGLLSLIPNLLPAGVAFGIWAVTNGQVGMSLAVILGMTLGIVVDDTVHFISKYLHAIRDLGYSSEDAVRYAFSTVGVALWVTTFVLIAGFSMLILSNYKINIDMGLMTALTIGIALIIDFLLLPPLLMLVKSKKGASA
jgi:predicted RND superfamily exporter protein